MSERARAGLGPCAWAALVVVASFLHWGTFVVVVDNPMGSLFEGLGASLGEDLSESLPALPAGTMTLTVRMTGWHGTVTVDPLELPNAAVAVWALALAALAWLRATGRWAAPRMLELALGILALAHLVIFILGVTNAENGTLGPGSWLALLGVLGVSVAARGVQAPEPLA